MVVGIIFAIGIIVAIFLANTILDNKDFVETFVIGVCLYFVTHACVSFSLFFFDIYSITGTVCATLIILAVIASISLIKKKYFKFNSSKTKEFIIPLLIALILLPLISIKNEYYGMGQDEGVYQTQVLAFLDGDTKTIKNFPGYYEHSDYNQTLFDIKADNLSGLDTDRTDYLDLRPANEGQTPSGYLHGIPVFSAFMATWASICGYSNMQGIQSIFYVLLLLLTYFCARNLGLKYYLCCLSEFAVGFCPLIVWLGKSALTELFLGVMIALFMYFITSDDAKLQYYSIIPVIVFSIYHISFYTKAPVFIGIYGMMYFLSRRKSHAMLLLSIPVIWIVAMWASLRIQPVYTTNNYEFMFGKYQETISEKTMPWLITLAAVAILIIELLYIFIVNKFCKKTSLKSLSNNKLFLNCLRLLIILPILKMVASIYLHRNKEQSITRAVLYQFKIHSFTRFILVSGVILFVVALIIATIKPAKLIKNNAIMVLSIMFFYCVIINSAFLSVSVPMLYYWGRYLIPFVAVSILFVMSMVNGMKKWFVYSAFVLGIVINIPANIFLINHVDDTKMNWHIISDISNIATSEDTIIVAEDSELVMWMATRYTSDAAVYPQLGDLPSQADDILRSSGGNVYIISSSELKYDYADMELVYSDNTTYIPDNDNPYPSTLTYPNSFNEESKSIYVYKCALMESGPTDYDINHFYNSYNGLSINEDEYAWTCESDVTLNCYLVKDSYTASVEFYGGIPYVALTGNPYSIDISVNGTYIDTVVITIDDNYNGFTFNIDKSYMKDGKNIITFSSELWDGTLLNPNETRMFGYPLHAVSFRATQSAD